MNHRATLGVTMNASAEEIKKAYRKLAMLHHPDRGGDTAKFQAIQSAYQELENSGFAPYEPPRTYTPPPQRRPAAPPEAPPGTWRDRNETIDDIFEQMKATRTRGSSSSSSGTRYPGAKQMYGQAEGEIIAPVTIREAFSGFNVQVTRKRGNGLMEHVYVNVPAGTPNGHRGRYKLSDGSSQTIITRMESKEFKVRGFEESGDLFGAGGLFSAGMEIGDIETEIEIDAMDLITGQWIDVKDFLGAPLKVRVPAGFNPQQRLKVANKGYAGWSQEYQEPTKTRRDMYIRLRPVFNRLNNLSPDKLRELQEQINGLKNAS